MENISQNAVPLTSFQKELWLSCQTSLSEYAETSIRGSFRIANNVSPERLRQAIGIVLGHTPLPGASLRQDAEEPYFLIGAFDDVDLRVVDVRDAADPEQAAWQFADLFFEESVETRLIRYALLRTDEEECLYLVKCSHLVLDGLGMFCHTAFVADVYAALAQGRTPDFGEPRSCLAEYRADEAHFASSRFAKDMEFWERHLEWLPEKRIFRSRPGCPDMLGRTRYRKYVLSEEASRQAGELLARYGVSPATYFTALHALAVSYMCDEKSVVVQTPVAFGERKAYWNRQGTHFAMPPLFLDLRERASFKALLEDVTGQSAKFFRHARTPFQLAMRNLGHKNLSYVADTFMNYLPNAPEGSPDFRITHIWQHHSEHEPALFGALVMQECGTRRFSLTVRSSRNHLSEQDVDRYVRRLESLTHQLASGADLPQLVYLLDEEERELRRWQRGDERNYPVRSMPSLFDEKAMEFAQRDAVRDERGAVLSYSQLRENSLRCAAWLAGQGLKKGDVVAVLARRTLRLPEIILGIQRCGAVYLPVDPDSPADRLAYIVADAGAVLTLDCDDAAYAAATLATPSEEPAPEDGAYLIYTSGSTGRPKGVLAPHGGFVNMIQGQIEMFGVGPQDRVLQFAPPIFDASLSEVFMALFAGACLYPVSDQYRNAPWTLKQHMADNGVTVATFPPSYLRLFDGEPFPGLRALITAGEPPVAADALRYAGALRYFNAYGPTETCVCAAMKLVAPDESLPISCGRPIPNVSAHILDSQGRPRPAGMAGELWVGGASVALGYHGNRELTKQRFRPLLGENGGTAYATGDLALWSEAGEILLVGRADDQVKIRGNRVELGEVAFLLEGCEDVHQASVLAVKDAAGQTMLAAFLALRPEATLEAVSRWSRLNLPPYMTPSFWRTLDAMPVTRTGKIDRQALRRMAEAPAQPERRERPVDRRLLDACERVLGGSYDPETDFFTQGGNSLRAMELLREVRKAFGADLAFRDFAACETLYDVEALLRQRGEQAQQGEVAAAPLSRRQFQIWAYQQANDRTADYNMPLLLEARGENAECFAEALGLALGDQELLRCVVDGDIDAPRFVKRDGAAIPVQTAEFSDAAAAMAFFDKRIHAPFDLRREPPVRMATAKLADRTQILVTMHHIVGDGETLDIALRNALRYLRGDRPDKGLLAVQAEFCRREEAYLRSDACRADAAYWQAALTPPTPPVNSSTTRRGAMAIVDLPPELAAGLDRLARRSGSTELACFVTLLARFLCRTYGRSEMLVGVPMGLRETQEEFRTAGFFVNSAPLRVPLPEAPDLTAAVKATTRRLLEAATHSRYCDFAVAPDFLATHSHTERIEEPGLSLRRLAPQLRASKFTGSFTLETGADPLIVLEHDAGFIPDGAAFLAELLRDMASALNGEAEADAPDVVGTVAAVAVPSVAEGRDAPVSPAAPVPSSAAEGAGPYGPCRALASAWAEILHAAPGESADFFRSGGDSIKAIQITGMLHRNGVTALSAPDFLRTPRFADLCALLDRADQLRTGDARSGGGLAHPPVEAGRTVSLLPIQQALLRDHPEHWKSFHMLLPLELGATVTPEAVQAWLGTLPGRYEALRLAFSPQGAVVLSEPRPVELQRFEFAPDASPTDMLRAMVRAVTAGLDPETGATMGAGLAERGETRLLALVGHHLVLDAVSLDILQQDLRRFARTAGGADEGGEGCGLATRAAAMEKLVEEGAFPTPDDHAFWESTCRTPAAALDVMRRDRRDVASERAAVRTQMQGFHPEYAQSTPADLLAALAVALHGLGQRNAIFATLESHGRDALLSGCDLDRSLGWFTAVCPLPLTPAATAAEALKELRPWMSEVFTPRNCNAYGYLRSRAPKRFGYESQISFNYLGALAVDPHGDVAPLPALATPGSVPELLHPQYQPDSPLDLVASFDASGALHLLAYFSPCVLPAEWVSGLLDGWTAALRTLPAYRQPVAEEALAAVRAACDCAADDIELVERPNSCHEPMLYQRLASGHAAYTQQIEFHFEGDIDEFLLMAAWGKVVAQHESLRSLFPMPHDGEFYRVVLRRARTSTEYHDFSRLPQDVARAEADALLRTQRDREFDLGRGPLLRAQFFRLDDRTVLMSWCFHHLLMDGWCIGVLLRELFAVHDMLAGGASRPLPAPFPLAEYDRWLARFDETAAREYWASLLEGFAPLTGVGASSSRGEGEPETISLALDSALSDRLRAAATSHAVTLAVLTQGLWAVVLGSENGNRRDVVFGVVTSGRPAELEGMDRAVGLFIRTLPLRARWDEASGLGDLLADLREQSLRQMRHGYLPLAEMGRDLLDHLMVFENYPVDAVFGEDGPRLRDVRGYEKIPYPLGITVIPGKELRFRFLYDPSALDRTRVTDLLDRLHAALRATAEEPDISCRALEAALAAEAAGRASVRPAARPTRVDVGDAGQAGEDGVKAALAPTRAAPENAGAAVLPPSDDELTDMVRDIYAEALARPVPSPDADFFMLGGHSLSAMRVMALLSRRLSVKVAIDDVLSNPSPSRLAARLRTASAQAERVPRVSPEGEHPLSPGQQRIWFLQRLHEDSRVYQIPFAARLRTPVDRDALQLALLLLESRHGALRLRVSADAPEQRLASPGGLKLECRDGPCPEQDLELAPMEFGFDKPLVRAALYREGPSDFVLLFSAHHIVFDGWSSEIFVRELNQAYEAALRGTAPAWPPLELDYLSYAAWERRQEPAGLEELKQALLPLPERLRLPLDFHRPAAQGFAGGVQVFRLEAERGRALKARAREAGVTLFPVLAALTAVFLHRHTGQDDLIMGCPAANRELDQTQGMIGLFVNTLAIRARLQPDRDFDDLVRAVDEAFQRALATQSCPFEKVMDALGGGRDPTRNPLFDVFVALEDAAWHDHGQPPLRMQPLPLPHRTSKFDLSFYFREIEPDAYEVHLEYRTDLFREETVRNMCERLATLTDAVLRGDDAPLYDLELLPEREQRLLRDFNDTTEPFDLERDVDSRFREQAGRTPDQVAVFAPSGQSLTYGEFDALADAMADYLAGQGLSRGEHACVCFERSLEMLATIFAVMRLGAVYAPLAPNLPEERLRSIFEDLGPSTVICDPRFAASFARYGRRVLAPDARALPPPSAKSATTVGEDGVAPDSLAYVIFTSGSTGRPKGVQIEHRSLCNRLLWMQSRFPIGPGDVILQKTAASFDVSIWELFWWSWSGGALAQLEPEGEKDPARIVEAIHAMRVTVIHFVPSMLRVFLDYLESHPEERRRISTLRYAFASGEALSADLAARFNALLPAQLHNLYGPTEATVDVSWHPCLETPRSVVPIGRPVSNTGLHVLDARMRPAPLGVAGEIWISGVQVARGYLNRPDLTARSFVADPSVPGGRMYRTGDLGRWLPDGTLEYLGRNDDQVKIRGFRIELGEVEAALSRCVGVTQAAVRVCRVGGQDALEAFLLPREGADLSLRDLRAQLATMLPEHMRPALFHTVDEIPLTPSGKADRKRLQGAPLRPPARYEDAMDAALLEDVRALWRQVMPEVDVEDAAQGFFEMGGNSLLLVQLHGLLDQRWPGVFTLASLFSESTIRAQAAFIEQARGVARPRTAESAPDAPVAIIGMAVRLGDHADTERFWEDLAGGADLNAPLPEKRRREVRQIFEVVGYPFDEARLREAAYLSDISSFDHKRFGLSPGDAALLDPAQRVFLETAMQALDDAGYGGAALESRNVGFFVGSSPYRLFQDAVTRAFPDQAEQIYLLNVPSNAMARISYLKNWSGPAAAIDTACSSVLKAMHDACLSLRTGESCVALAGGAHVIDLPVKADRTFTIESASGLTRTFDAAADGVGAGEGAAVFVLKLLDQALRDNDAIHAVILGSAVNQDGRSASMAAPNPDAQAEVIALAARSASVSLTDVSFFEAHGTATALGDPVEIEGLSRAFAREGARPRRKIPVGSVKGNLGHLDAAAGAVGLAKAVLCLEKGFVPPQPHFGRPNPHIDFDAAPVRVPQSLEALPKSDRPWRCGVSSFGLSGVNAHVILAERAPADLTASPQPDDAWYCLSFSAHSESDLREYCRRVREAVARDECWPLHAIAGTLTAGRDHLDVRAAVAARTRQELLAALDGDIAMTRCSTRQDGADAGGVEAVCATRADAEEAARAFLSGRRLTWPADRPLHRVHLPATPFTRVPLWPRFATEFLSEPVQTPSGGAFAVALDRPDFWPVAEHRLNGVPTLAGMGLLDLIGKAVGRMPLCIENLRWRRPAIHAEGCRATLFVERRDDGQSVELQHLRDGTWTLAASADVRADGPTQPPALDVEALLEGLRAFEGRGEQSFISVSGRWDCREALWISKDGDRLLARLALPDAFRHDLHSFKWHPAMVDVAASLALHGVSGFVPASCGTARLFRPLPAKAFAYVVVTNRRPGMITARCTIVDQSGNVALEMDDLAFLSLARARPAQARPAARPEPELYAVEWARVELPHGEAAQPVEGGLMLLGRGEGALRDALAAGSRLRRELPAHLSERQALARDILDRDIRHIVYLPSPDDFPWAFCSLLQELCRACLRRPLRVTAVGEGALLPSGRAPEHALLLGPLLCLKQEEPLISCAYVEMASPAPASVRAFMDSLDRIDGPYVIDEDGNIRVRRLEALAVPTAPSFPAIAPDGCVAITGGLGGMGLTLARRIAAETGARVALLHRRERVAPDIPFAAYRCDVTDAAQVAEAFAAIRRDMGPVQGVVHAAGVAGDGYLSSKSREAYEAVLAPKVAGTWNLHRETLGDDLRFFVLASSRTSLTGAPGQCDYTAANAYLNAFARYRRAMGLPAVAICWNAWSGVGMAARHGADQGPFTLAPDQAFGVLTAALASGVELAVAAMSGEDAASHPLATLVGAAPASSPASVPEAGLQMEPQAASADSLEAALLEIFQDCLGYETALSREDDFFALGGDSIAGTRIVSRMDQVLGVKASVVDLLESETLGDFLDRTLADRKRDDSAEQSLQPAPARDKYPVGREQLSILYADMLSEGGLGFNLPAFLKLPRDLDKSRLEESVGALIQRHEALRTSFCDFDAERPNMIIQPFAGFTLEEARLPDLSRKDALIAPFDLKKEALFRVKLLTLDDGEHVLFFDVHHALADGRTISLLNAELFRLYHGLPLEPVSAQQKDFAWRQFTRSNAEDKAYWLSAYQGDLPKLDLPADFRRPPAQTGRGGMHEFELSAELAAGIKNLARREGVTNYHVVLTAWTLLAHAYTGNDDIVIAVSVDSREEHLNTAGMLASLLPLRLRIDNAKPLSALLKDNQRVSNEALRHRGYILNNLLTDLKPSPCLDRSMLSEVILSYMNFEFASGERQLFETLRFSKFASKTDLSIFASDTGSSVSFALEYYADLFSHENVVGMAEDFTRILELMTTVGANESVRFTHAPHERRAVESVQRSMDSTQRAMESVRRAMESSRRELGGALREDIRRLAARKGVSAAAIMLATWAALLNRVTTRQDFIVDATPGGPIRFSIDDDTEFGDLLAQVHEHLLRARREPQAALGDATREASPDGAFLRVAFAWDEAGEALPPADGPGIGRHDLVCSVLDHGDGVTVRLDHDTRALDAETAGKWLGYYALFLDGAAKGNS